VRSAAKWGALVGVISYLALGILLPLFSHLLFGTSAADLNANSGRLALGCLGIFALLFAFSAAGFFAGRESLRPAAGTIAGMIAFVLYTMLGAIYEPGGAIRTAGTGNVFSQLVAALIVIGFAALMGWLGGRPGAQQGLRRARTAQLTEATTSADRAD
jgi:cellobiose-specific phosphotransferase system component IIC